MKYAYGAFGLALLAMTLGRTMIVVHLRLAIRRSQRRPAR